MEKEIIKSKDVTIKIEADVPIPGWNIGNLIRPVSEWAFMNDMEFGQSFTLNSKDYDLVKAPGAIRSFAYGQGYKIATRKVDKNTIRIWKLRDEESEAAKQEKEVDTTGGAASSF